MNILLTMFFKGDKSVGNTQAYLDYFYHWLILPLIKYDVDVKFLVSEYIYKENRRTHFCDSLNLVLLRDDEVDYLFDFNNISFSEIYKRIHIDGLNDSFFMRLDKVCDGKFKKWIPDIIISQGANSAYNIWHKIYPKALCLTQENSIFSRIVSRRSLTYDPFNSITDSFIIKNCNEIINYKVPIIEGYRFNILKKEFVEFIDRQSFISEEMKEYKSKFRYLVLLPLVGNMPFEENLYQNEKDLIKDVMEKFPKNVGVCVTQHDAFISLTREEIAHYRKNYPNFIFLEKTNKRGYSSNSLHYFKYVDAVLNITSKTGYLALFWDKPVLSFAKTFNNLIKDGQGIEDLDKVLGKKVSKKNNVLFWILTHYTIFEEDYSKGDFLYLYLKEKLEKYRKEGINENFFTKVNDINKICSYIVPLSVKRPTFLQQIFSVRNEGSHKVLRILGLKVKFRRRI